MFLLLFLKCDVFLSVTTRCKSEKHRLHSFSILIIFRLLRERTLSQIFVEFPEVMFLIEFFSLL